MSILQTFYKAKEYFSKVWRDEEHPTALLEIMIGGARLTIPGDSKSLTRTWLPLTNNDLDHRLEASAAIEWAIELLLRKKQNFNLGITGRTEHLFCNSLERQYLADLLTLLVNNRDMKVTICSPSTNEWLYLRKNKFVKR